MTKALCQADELLISVSAAQRVPATARPDAASSVKPRAHTIIATVTSHLASLSPLCAEMHTGVSTFLPGIYLKREQEPSPACFRPGSS